MLLLLAKGSDYCGLCDAIDRSTLHIQAHYANYSKLHMDGRDMGTDLPAHLVDLGTADSITATTPNL